MALGDGPASSVAFLGLNAVAWLPLGGDVWEFTALDGYEAYQGRLPERDVVSGDLNNDGRKDLVFMETAKNYLDLVIFDADTSSCRVTMAGFRQRTFRGREWRIPEPREAVVTDLTGDGKNDLAVVVHDRILVYYRNNLVATWRRETQKGEAVQRIASSTPAA